VKLFPAPVREDDVLQSRHREGLCPVPTLRSRNGYQFPWDGNRQVGLASAVSFGIAAGEVWGLLWGVLWGGVLWGVLRWVRWVGAALRACRTAIGQTNQNFDVRIGGFQEFFHQLNEGIHA
jgi:hypothetical protein